MHTFKSFAVITHQSFATNSPHQEEIPTASHKQTDIVSLLYMPRYWNKRDRPQSVRNRLSYSLPLGPLGNLSGRDQSFRPLFSGLLAKSSPLLRLSRPEDQRQTGALALSGHSWHDDCMRLDYVSTD